MLWFEQLSVLLTLIPNKFKKQSQSKLGLHKNKQCTDLTISIKNPSST